MSFDTFDGFLSSVSLILVSEIGDKTFFIASLLAMRHADRALTVFAGAYFALILMTILSSAIGLLALQVLSPVITTFFASLVFAYYAIFISYSLYYPDHNDEDELGETEQELEQCSYSLSQLRAPCTTADPPFSMSLQSSTAPKTSSSSSLSSSTPQQHHNADESTQPSSPVFPPAPLKFQIIAQLSQRFSTIVSPLFVQCCVLTFIAEWGDRSQLSTILMSSRWSAAVVAVGCLLGHMCCTGLAVVGGKLLAERIPERALQLASVVLFVCFALHGFWEVFITMYWGDELSATL